MKKAVLMSMSAVMILSTPAFAAGLRAVEVKGKYESSIREGQRTLDTVSAAQLERVRQDAVRDLSALTSGRVNTREMNAALSKTFKLNDGGHEIQIDMTKIAQAVRDAKSVTSTINKNELDVDATKLFEQKERALEIIPKFMALASIVSKNTTGTRQKEVDAFVKQMSLLKESLTSMDSAELKSHLDVMEIAIENKLRNPELEGDQAYAQALKTKFGNKYATKLEEILGCARQ